MRARDVGCTRVWLKEDTAPVEFELECHEALRDAWMAGKAFFDGKTLSGSEMTIKLGQVVLIVRCTPESVAIADADNDAIRAERRIKGDD